MVFAALATRIDRSDVRAEPLAPVSRFEQRHTRVDARGCGASPVATTPKWGQHVIFLRVADWERDYNLVLDSNSAGRGPRSFRRRLQPTAGHGPATGGLRRFTETVARGPRTTEVRNEQSRCAAITRASLLTAPGSSENPRRGRNLPEGHTDDP